GKVPDLPERWHTAGLEQERQGNLLRVAGQQDDGSPGEVRWEVVGNRNTSGPVPGSHCGRSPARPEQAAIRRVFRWPAISGQPRHGRRRGLSHHAHLPLASEGNPMSFTAGTRIGPYEIT